MVAGDIDPATERIVEYLASRNVPINVLFFRYFSDDGRAYLARTWLLDEARVSAKAGAKGGSVPSKEPWNEQDWYVTFGEYTAGRNWDDARKYGFVSAGGGEWYSRTFKKLPEGARVFTYIPKTGYVGVGTVTGPEPFDMATVLVDGEARALSSLPLVGTYVHPPLPDDEDAAEYVVPVSWYQSRPRESAVWAKGMFASEHPACKLRNRFTLEQLATAFNLDEDGPG